MSSSNSKPDLEESINVAEAHAPVPQDAAAAAREKKLADPASQPITLWVLAACGIVAVIAGGILGAGGKLFSYADTFVAGYVRAKAPGAGDSGPLPKSALDAYMAKGAKIYDIRCKSCHGPGAQGDGANYPSLVGSDWVLGDTQRFAMIILNGLEGATSTGKAYPGAMPAQGPLLSGAEDLAGVMTYVRNNFGNSSGDVVTVEMAAAALEISSSRQNAGQPTRAGELAEYAKPLPGEALDPATMVNPITLEPAVEAPAP